MLKNMEGKNEEQLKAIEYQGKNYQMQLKPSRQAQNH